MLEVCVDSIDSAIAAEAGGAGRIELCTALSEGGLTPTPGILKALKKDACIKIPIFCMLRPRRGNDFQFTSIEIESLIYDIEILRNYGADGFVFGALTGASEIDSESCKSILRATGDLPVTFHRAFDVTNAKDMLKNVEIIKKLGFKRILTSGFESTAFRGINNLKELVKGSEDIIIMPGSGINCGNLGKILLETDCTEFHASARIKISSSDISTSISMGDGKEDREPRQVTCSKLVRELVKIENNIKKENCI